MYNRTVAGITRMPPTRHQKRTGCTRFAIQRMAAIRRNVSARSPAANPVLPLRRKRMFPYPSFQSGEDQDPAELQKKAFHLRICHGPTPLMRLRKGRSDVRKKADKFAI